MMSANGTLPIPPNLTLVPLPPKCPELNVMENVWQFICRSRHSIPRTPLAGIETPGGCDGVSATRNAVKPGAFGAPLRGLGA
ncbi:hypothetical protein [Falsiroseomonas sp. E2-1-a4]|uniref:hypothetical protein n=1 Tax=Falsiroseomonas sp. E2-1-a4 TaxID=3239299 RepID=UPI003F332227